MTILLQSHWLKLFIRIITILCLVVDTAHSAMLPQVDESFKWSTNTTSRLGGSNFEPICTRPGRSQRWIAPSYSQDCQEALHYFQRTDVARYGAKTFEFREQRTPSVTGHPNRLIPRAYTFDKCTIAIGLVGSVPPALFPNPEPEAPPGGWPKQDVADYKQIYALLRQLMTTCITDETAGWVQTGTGAAEGAEGGIGLFMFATDSVADKTIEG